MKSHDINNFIEQNVKNFDIETGWVELVRKMLFEFCIAGWNLENGISGKQKFAELRCYPSTSGIEFNISIEAIAEYYQELSKRTCEECGENGKHRDISSWQTILCFQHYMEAIGHLSIEDLVFFCNGMTFDLKTCNYLEFDLDYRKVKFYKNNALGEETLYCILSEKPNYYKLLKHLPRNMLTKEQSDYLDSFFAGLDLCDICGHIAVHKNSCKYCFSSNWDSESNKDGYADKSDYIKQSQLYNYIDEYDFLKEMESDTSFEKSPTHEILFTYEELEEYRNSLSEND